jgi:hypothetical protein
MKPGRISPSVSGTWRRALLVTLVLSSQCVRGELWISPVPLTGEPQRAASTADKVLYIGEGTYPDGTPAAVGREGVERSALVIGPDDQVAPARVRDDRIQFHAPLKGHHWVFLQQRSLQGETLQVEVAKYRFYNRQGDVGESLLKEIRGRTNESKYGRPPVAAVPFEIVLQKPQQAHHISCCLYSGDRVRARLYYRQQALQAFSLRTLSDSGWRAEFEADEDGLASFEIPRYRYSDSGSRRRNKQYLLITADYQVEEPGTFQGKPYRQMHYRVSRPIDFRPSPLEWAAKLPAFLLLGGVILVTGFGVFLYRLRLRRRRYASV